MFPFESSRIITGGSYLGLVLVLVRRFSRARARVLRKNNLGIGQKLSRTPLIKILGVVISSPF